MFLFTGTVVVISSEEHARFTKVPNTYQIKVFNSVHFLRCSLSLKLQVAR